MAATRLNDAQKQELVSRFRSGAGTQELATAYGCSPNTVTRVVKAAIEPALYEELKRQRGRRAGQTTAPEATAAEQGSRQPELSLETAEAEAPESPADPPEAPPLIEDGVSSPVGIPQEPDTDDRPGADAQDHEAARGLAIDDADDFDDFDEEDDDGEEPDDDAGAGFVEQTFVEVPISLAEGFDQPLTTPRPWCADELPTIAYMLVDKTVELQARPLAEIPELGRLEPAELELQALVLYSNPRQAKRHCGRTQRVIPVPDVSVLERRASYLLRQGICRVVVEGALYALPEG